VDVATEGYGILATRHHSEFSLEQLVSLEKIKASFFNQRRKDEHLRDFLRRDAKQMLRGITWTEERRFLASIENYFLGRGGIGLTDGELDREVAGLIEHGRDSYWDTPSSELYNHIRTENDPDRIIEILDETKNSLNQHYMNVRRQFKAVQEAIILNT
jgi:hypothetical protein